METASDINPILEGEIIPSAPEKPKIAKVRYTHDAMIDMLLANPAIKQNDLADIFGYTASWVSSIMSSDAFQARFEQRRAEVVDPALAARVSVNFKAMVLRSQEIIMDKLAQPSAHVSDALALKAFELSTRAAGYGLKQQPPTEVDVTVHLNTLQQNIVGMLRNSRGSEQGYAEDDETDPNED
jgi:hypothetical protein